MQISICACRIGALHDIFSSPTCYDARSFRSRLRTRAFDPISICFNSMAPKQTAAKIVAELRASDANIATIRAELARQGFSKSRISQVCPLQYKAAIASKDDEDEMPALMPTDHRLSGEAGDVVVGGAFANRSAPSNTQFLWL